MLSVTRTRGRTLSEALRAQNHQPLRVLIVEDDSEMRALITEQLRRSGFEVVPAEDGLEAIDCLRHSLSSGTGGGFDVVVADIRMPGLNGLELLADLRRTHWDPPVILITAFGSPETHQEAKRLGAWAVLDKPFGFEQLQAAIRNAA